MELQDPMVAFSIFSCVTITRGGTFITVDEGLSFITRLLKGFMLGFAIATGVSLFILPITSRGHVFQDIKSYAFQIDAVLQAQLSFVKRSSTSSVWTGDQGLLERTRTAQSGISGNGGAEPNSELSLDSRRQKLTAAIGKLNALHGKLQSDLFYSKDEFAWGKLSAGDLTNIGDLLRNVLLPLSGMAMLPDILDMTVNGEGTRNNSIGSVDDPEEDNLKRSEIKKVVETLKERLGSCTDLMSSGLQYILVTLDLFKRKQLEKQLKARNNHSNAYDEESKGDILDPLLQDFTVKFEQALYRYHLRRKELPEALASLEAFSSPDKRDEDSTKSNSEMLADPDVRQEFFLIVYMDHLQHDLLRATLDLIRFADNKVSDGTMKRSRLIFPNQNSIWNWITSSSTKQPPRRQPTTSNLSTYQDSTPEPFPEPETLPPSNIFEKTSSILRQISRLIRSEKSMFGFRVAAAAFCVGIVAYLHQTQEFFIRQRGIWAMIVIVIGMSPTSGQTMFGFVARIAATVVSLALSLIVWYIVDGRTPGVIVFLYLANVFEVPPSSLHIAAHPLLITIQYYFYLKTPQYFGAAMIAIVTLNVIVGYELQVRKLGLETATSNGQPYYPIYLFGPYKLATVAIGCGISFFWVVFPYPITAKSKLRKMLGRGLFVLAEFYSAMHATVEVWLGEIDTAGAAGNSTVAIQGGNKSHEKLARHRQKLFKEEMTLLNALRAHSHFTTFEPPIGGKFPKQTYDALISETQRMLTAMALMAHTTQNLSTQHPKHHTHQQTQNETPWSTHLARLTQTSPTFNSHAPTSLLCHLSASLTNAQPLPPFLAAGDSFPLAREMRKVDGKLLSIRYIEDSGFSAFVALEMLRSVVGVSLRELLR